MHLFFFSYTGKYKIRRAEHLPNLTRTHHIYIDGIQILDKFTPFLDDIHILDIHSFMSTKISKNGITSKNSKKQMHFFFSFSTQVKKLIHTRAKKTAFISIVAQLSN